MEILSTCYEIISEVTNHEYTFRDSYNLVCKDIKGNDKARIASFCGFYFRNYFLIEHLASYLKLKKDGVAFVYLGLLFANNSFLHYLDDNSTFSLFLEKAITEGHSFTKEDLNFIKNVITKKRCSQFFDVKKGTIEYYSIRFNKPGWLIKLLLKQFQSKPGFKLLYEISKMPRQFAKVSYAKKFNPNQNFIKVEGDLYEYLNDTSIRKEDVIHDKTLFITQACVGKILKKIDLNNSNITLFQGYETNLCHEVFKKYIENNNINFISDDFKKVYKNFDVLRKYEEKNAHFYEAKEDGLLPILHLKQDLIIYSPDSSNFELFRRNPEYGVYFKPDKIDGYITAIRNGLNEISSFLDDNGKLLFIVPTLNLKETHYLIDRFIENNPFNIIEEKFFLPNQEENSLMYYAILGKKHE